MENKHKPNKRAVNKKFPDEGTLPADAAFTSLLTFAHTHRAANQKRGCKRTGPIREDDAVESW